MYKKIFMKVFPVLLLIAVILSTTIFGATVDTNMDSTITTSATGSQTLNNVAMTIWKTVKVILQILAVGAVIFAGVRYMFASADTKADIKKQMGILAVGAALAFGATILIDIVINISGEIFKNTTNL